MGTITRSRRKNQGRRMNHTIRPIPSLDTGMSLDAARGVLQVYITRPRYRKLLAVLNDDGFLRGALEVFESDRGQWFRGTDAEVKFLVEVLAYVDEATQ